MVLNVELNSDQAEQLRELAKATGRNADELMKEALDSFLAREQWLREQVQVGLDQARRGELLEDEEVRTRIDRMFAS